jgi:hypothetical protein
MKDYNLHQIQTICDRTTLFLTQDSFIFENNAHIVMFLVLVNSKK